MVARTSHPGKFTSAFPGNDLLSTRSSLQMPQYQNYNTPPATGVGEKGPGGGRVSAPRGIELGCPTRKAPFEWPRVPSHWRLPTSPASAARARISVHVWGRIHHQQPRQASYCCAARTGRARDSDKTRMEHGQLLDLPFWQDL